MPTAMRPSDIRRALVGDRPLWLLALAAPTAIAVALDAAIRWRTIAAFALQGKAIYLSSLLISAAFWTWPLSAAARLAGDRPSVARRAGLAAIFFFWVLPFATCCFGGQAVYYRVFHAYVGRDTVRLGVALRGTIGDWLTAWSGPWLLAAMAASGAAIALALLVLVRRAAPGLRGRAPLLPALAFCGAAFCFWTDQVDSRFLQAAVPDACFVHGVTHALRAFAEGRGRVRQGMSLRTPAPLPPLPRAPQGPDVLVILTESVRADALCSAPPPWCRAPFLDAVVPDRIPLGVLTSQTPNTFSACMVLWTGLAPDADFQAAHSAPVLWELARAEGYRTAYVTSQNPRYEDFGAFTVRAGIDVRLTATELGGMGQEQIGAPDERATAAVLRFVRDAGAAPYFAVLHLSNTHAPYRDDPSLRPFEPESADPLGPVTAFHDHYRNAVRLQERTVAALLREVRALPSWDRTAVVFLSDHGEQFREHGGLYHNHSLFDEELRVPGWIAAGPRALDAARRDALRSYAGARTYTEDVHETIVDLLGLEGARAALPYASLVAGRSLLRRWPGPPPTALLATETSVWEPDDARFGATSGSLFLVGAPGAMSCFDTARDPRERAPLPPAACDALRGAAARAEAFGR